MSDSSQHRVTARAAVEHLRVLGVDALPDVEHLVQQHVAIALTHHQGQPFTQRAHAAVATGSGRGFGRGFSRRARLVLTMTALVVLATASLASANELPAPLQDAVADAAHMVGIPVPRAHRHASGAGNKTEGDSVQITSPGKSESVRSDGTVGKGAATSAAARQRRLDHAADVAAARLARAERKAARKAEAAARRRDAAQRAAHVPHRVAQRPASVSHGTGNQGTGSSGSNGHGGGSTAGSSAGKDVPGGSKPVKSGSRGKH